MDQMHYRPLMTYERVPGFLCDWHLAGPFEAGLKVDPNAVLFQKKESTSWLADHLAPCGGAAAVSVPPPPCPDLPWNWDLLPATFYPTMWLRAGAKEFPAWQQRLKGLNPDTWSKLYYALAIVESPVETPAELVFSGWDGCRLWVNGQLLFEEHSYHHVILEMERVKFTLRKGLNTFLFQLDRDGVAARIELPAGIDAAALRSVALSPAPEPRRLATMVQLRRHAMTRQVQMPFTGSTPDDLRQWQEKFYAHFARCLGDAPVTALRPGSARLVSETPRDGYVERLYHAPIEGDCVLPCYVLVPDKARANGRALVTIHGHNDYRSQLGHYNPRAGHYNYTQEMARRGFLAGLICLRSFSDRRDEDRPGDTCDMAAMLALAQGLTLARLHIADLQVLADVMVQEAGADPERLGVTGLSGGGSLTYLSAAFDKRFKAAAEFCGLCRYYEYATGLNGCGTQTVPGLFPGGDSPEILSLIAPRPLLLGQGTKDSTFHVLGVKSIADDTRRAYRAAGAEDRLEVSFFDLGHDFEPDVAEKFFLRWL